MGQLAEATDAEFADRHPPGTPPWVHRRMLIAALGAMLAASAVLVLAQWAVA